MNIAQLESEIAERLSYIQGVADLEITVLPQRQSDYKKTFKNPRITVVLQDIVYGAPQNTGDTNQTATSTFSIFIESRKLRDANGAGAYEIYEKVRQVLVGYRPANYDKIYGIDFQVQSYEEGVFCYVFTIAARCMVVEATPDPNCDTPTVTQITYLNA